MIKPDRPKRDELAQQINFFPWYKAKGKSGGLTADERLSRAEDLRAKGKSPDEIFKIDVEDAGPDETGFGQNSAGQWLFETRDNMALTPLAKEQMKEKFGGGPWGETTDQMELGRLMTNDILFDYDPDIAKVKTRLSQPNPNENVKGSGMFLSPQDGSKEPFGEIEATGGSGIDPESNEPWSLFNTLGHEVTHVPQSKYGLPIGGREYDPDRGAFFKSQMQPMVEAMRQKIARDRELFAKDFAMEMGGDMTALEKGRLLWAQEKPDQAALLEQSEYVGGKPGMFAKAGTPAQKKQDPIDYYKQYRSLSGEQSARQGADRMNMSIEEKRNDPWFHADAGSRDVLSPALQMNRWGPGQFSLPNKDLWMFNSKYRGKKGG